MWTSTIELDFKKVLLAQLIGRFYRNIYFSSYSPLQVQNLPRQSLPNPSWVRVRNRLAGISGTDLHLLYGDSDVRVAPSAMPGRKQLYPGREVVGEVIEIGDDVRHLHVGDRVVLQNSPNCLSAALQSICRFCMAGSYNLCENSTMSPQPLGGGWSEEMLLHEQQLFQIPAGLNNEQAVMLEPTAVALHAVLRRLPRHGERVLIVGAGSIGLSILQILRSLAPQTEVSVLARHSFQVERATRLGAAHIIYPRDAYIGVKRATQARLYQGPLGNQTLSGGYDVIYDTVGQRKTLQNALRWTRAQGTIILVGSNLHMMHVDLTPLWYQEINLLGSTSHGMEYWPIDGREQRSTFEVAAELMEQGRIAPEQLITHHFALNNYKSALVTATNKAESRAVKVVFDYSLLPASVVPNVRASAPRRRPVTVNFDIAYPDAVQGQQEYAPDQQEEMQKVQQSSVPDYISTPYTPFPYAATIQETPPIKSPTKEVPPVQVTPVPQPSASSSAYDEEPDNYDDYTDSDDTATAIPVVSKHMPIPAHVEAGQYDSTPTHVRPEHDASYQVFPLELATPLPPDNSPPAAVPDAAPESVAPEQSEQHSASQGSEPQEQREVPEPMVAPAEVQAEPGAQSLEVAQHEVEGVEVAQHKEDAEQDQVQASQAPTSQEYSSQEQVHSEAAPERIVEIAAELDPQTLEPGDESAPTQTQRPRSSNRKRKYNSRL